MPVKVPPFVSQFLMRGHRLLPARMGAQVAGDRRLNVNRSGFMLFTRCPPRSFDGLAVMSAIPGSFYWLGFETPELSSGMKRLALPGA